MSDNGFRVPGSSLAELEKIIEAYSTLGSNISLDAVSKLVGVHKTAISRNNPFLTEVGLLEGSNKKNPTSLGLNLGRAIHHEQVNDVKIYWREVITGNEFLSNLISTVRIQKGMTSDGLSAHVLYAADLSKTSSTNKAGANAIVDILVKSELLHEEGGQFVVSTKSTEVEEITSDKMPSTEVTPPSVTVEPQITPAVDEIPANIVSQSIAPTIAINIQLQLPETENPIVYDNLFKSLRKNLLNPSDDND